MEKKYLVSVPSWEIEDRHIVFNISTIPPTGETFNTKRRYREFERLSRKLDAKKLPRLSLPGKLLMHSDPAIENRRVKLEKTLKNYVQINEMNPVLEEFLSPRDDTALHSSRRSSMQDSIMTVDDSVITTRNGDSVMPLEEEEPGFAETPQTGSEDESDAPSEQSLTWALEMLAARSSYRAERRTNLRLARIYTLATIATLLGTLTARSHKWPLIGAAFGTAVSAGFALLSAIWVKRTDDWRRRGFGLNESALASTDGLDVRKLISYLEERRREPQSSASSPKTLSSFTPTNEKKQLETIVEEELTNEDKRSPAGVLDSNLQETVIDETLMAKLDALHTMGSHYEIISMIKTHENFNHPSVSWRWARAVYYHTLFDTDGSAVAERLQEVLTHLHQSTALQRSALVHKWIAITHNALGDRRGAIKDKVEAGLAFELHTKTALEIDPQDPTLHYMHGRFCFDVAGLSWIERQGARAISGKEPPRATYQEALQHYLNALTLKQSPAFYLEVGRCYQKLKKDPEALENFRKAAEFVPPDGEPLSIEEESAREEAKGLLKKLAA